MKRARLPHALRAQLKRRHWRLVLALVAHRIERRIGRDLSDDELAKLVPPGDPLQLREMWLRFGGRLEVRDGQLQLSRSLKSVHQLSQLQRVG